MLDCKEYFPNQPLPKSMFLAPVLENDIEKAVNLLKNGISPGLYGVNSTVIKKHFKEISSVILYIVNLSFETGVFPERLKNAMIIPIFKKGVREAVIITGQYLYYLPLQRLLKGL